MGGFSLGIAPLQAFSFEFKDSEASRESLELLSGNACDLEEGATQR